MKKNYYPLICCMLFCVSKIFAQAHEYDIHNDKKLIINAQSYAFSKKMDDRILFMFWKKNKITVQVFDTLMNAKKDDEILLDPKFNHNIYDIVFDKNYFTIIDYTEIKNFRYIKLWRYSSALKLLKTENIKFAPKVYDPRLPEFKFSEDKKTILVYEKEGNNDFLDLCVFNVDSLKKNWEARFTYKRNTFYDFKQAQFVVSNTGNAFLIFEIDKLKDKERRLEIEHYNETGEVTETILPEPDFFPLQTKYSFDNVNRKLCAAGVYAEKNETHASGIYNFSIQIPEHKVSAVEKNAFDDEFVGAFTGKKVSNTKGLTQNLVVQDIIHRRDGGMIIIVEDVNIMAPAVIHLDNIEPQPNIDLTIRYAYQNAFAAAIEPDGKIKWRSVFVKHQNSKDDRGSFSSFFVVKKPTELHFIFNDEISRSTLVTDYILTPTGEVKRRNIADTKGASLQLCFRDAQQIGANEILVPSLDGESVNLVKIKL